MPFVQMENITNFLAACKNLGVAEVDLFVTVDLFEAKNMLQVQNCLDKLRIRFDGGEVRFQFSSKKAHFFRSWD